MPRNYFKHRDPFTPQEFTAFCKDVEQTYAAGQANRRKRLASKYRVSEPYVDAIVRRYGFVKDKESVWAQQKDQLIKDYIDGMTYRKLGKKYKHFGVSIRNKIIEWKLSPRTVAEVAKKLAYPFDDSVFERIDSPEKAYWLGFIYADGCVTNERKGKATRFTMYLAKRDKRHIAKLKRFFRADHPIRKSKNNRGFSITSSKLCGDLYNLGVTLRKSLKLRFPTEDQMPLKYMSHFIRGYFDGDGCVMIRENQWVVNMIGTKRFLRPVEKALRAVGLPSKTLHKVKHAGQGRLGYLIYGGTVRYSQNLSHEHERRPYLDLLYDYLYTGATVWLDRKREKFEKALTRRYGPYWLEECAA